MNGSDLLSLKGGEILMGSVRKWRKKKIAKHKHRKRLKTTRWIRRSKK